MDKKLFRQSIFGFIFVGLLGSLGHFVFEWSGYNNAAGMFFPINESTWEHLKLLFFPYLIWSVIEYFLLGKLKGFIFSKAAGVLAGMLSIVSIFYTYTGAAGESSEFINILIFFIGVLTAFTVDYFMIRNEKLQQKNYNLTGFAIFVILFISFIAFTFTPPLIPLFRDPINLSYGI